MATLYFDKTLFCRVEEVPPTSQTRVYGIVVFLMAHVNKPYGDVLPLNRSCLSLITSNWYVVNINSFSYFPLIISLIPKIFGDCVNMVPANCKITSKLTYKLHVSLH